MLVHVVDISGCEGRDPLADYRQINAELASYSSRLAELPQIIAANKMDITGAEDNLAQLRAALGSNAQIFPVSAATAQGFDPLLDAVLRTLDDLPKTFEFEEEDMVEGHRYEPGFEIEMDGEVFVVTGGSVDYLLDTTYADDEESMRRFQQFLLKEGIIDALKAKGAGEESTIRMGEWEFDFID